MSNVVTQSVLESGLFSADSHVVEPVELWSGVLPAGFWAKRSSDTPRGGTDPSLREGEMVQDGVVAEVLYPTLGLHLFDIDDPETQEAAFRVYNDWLAEYCSVLPDRLLGIALISAYDTERAVQEIERCARAGFRGILIWQVPHPDLPLRSHHYDPIWAAASRLNLTVSFHILTGFPYRIEKSAKSGFPLAASSIAADQQVDFRQLDRLHRTVNLKLFAALDSTLEMILSGVFERFPDLRTIVVENECGWLPFAVTQWDYFCLKQGTSKGAEQNASPISKLPSAYVGTNVFATFFRDVLSAATFETWGSDAFMWSNDFPHHNSTWPRSRDFITTQLAGLSEEILTKVLRTNAERLYGSVPVLDVASATADLHSN